MKKIRSSLNLNLSLPRPASPASLAPRSCGILLDFAWLSKKGIVYQESLTQIQQIVGAATEALRTEIVEAKRQTGVLT